MEPALVDWTPRTFCAVQRYTPYLHAGQVAAIANPRHNEASSQAMEDNSAEDTCSFDLNVDHGEMEVDCKFTSVFALP